MGELFRRIRYFINRRQIDAELEREMEIHREMTAQAGRTNFGNRLRMLEESREAWGWTWLDRLCQDLRYATRTLARSPGFTLTAVLVMAIGIGVNVAAFALFNMVALEPLPVRDPGSLVRLQRRSPEIIGGEMPYAMAMFYRDHAKTLSGVLTMMGARLRLEDDLEPVKANFVSANFFHELGATAAYGRLLAVARDEAGNAAPVVVLGHEFWQQRFGADPDVVGKVVHLNRRPVTVVGVEPYGFPSLDGQDAEVWLPITQQPYLVEGSKVLTDVSDSSVRVWGRLAAGSTASQSEQELLALTNELRKLYPREIWKGEYIHSDPGGHLHVMEPGMYNIAEMVGVLTLLILTVTCANLGGLQLARGVAREREISIRLSVGASATRIFRQLLTESLVLALLGSVAGMLLACGALKVVLVQSGAPAWLSVAPDWRVLAFVVVIALAAAVLFGFAPALQIARQRQRKTLARQLLTCAQVAASCVLLIVASLLVRAAQHALYTNPGFGYEQVMSIDPGLGRHGYSAAAAQRYLDQLRSRLQAAPGVTSVSLVKLAPMGHTISRIDTDIKGRPAAIYPNWVDAGFFRTMEIPLRMGRSFVPGEKNTVIVSESLARRQWPGENPLGKPYLNDGTVVGVAGNARVNAMNNGDAMEMYQPTQMVDMPDMVVLIKSAGAVDGLAPIAKSIVESLDPKLFPEITLLKSGFRKDMEQVEAVALAVTLVGLVAVALSSVGIVGLVLFSVSQRMKEIAIRTALGAGKLQVLGAVLRQFMWPVALGAAAGAGIAAAASRVLRIVLYGVSNLDPASYLAAILALAVIVFLAALLPARRALRPDLAKTLHFE
ncbi:MAG: ABC transporter permease [Bryobacteraceae bacterium]